MGGEGAGGGRELRPFPTRRSADLAEHDEMASSILITPSLKIAEAVQIEIETWLKKLPREKIARKSIEERGAIIITESMDEAISLMNQIGRPHV